MTCCNSLKIWGMALLVFVVTPMAPASADVVSIPITIVTDNVEQELAGTHDPGIVSAGSSDLELGMENIYPQRPDDAPQRIGLRFLDVNVPVNATINSAHIQFKVKQGPKSEESAAEDASVTIYGRDSADAPAFTFGLWELSDITDLTSPVDWEHIPLWPDAGVAGPDQLTPNLVSIVEEIIGLEGWAAGNAMAFLIDPMTVDGNFSRGTRTATSFSNGSFPDPAPVLTIDFTLGSDPSADFDIDTDVDGKDFLSWQGGYGTIGGASKGQGDANDDGNVDADDLAIWQTQFGNLTAISAANAVPEPSAAILLALAALGMLGVRNRQQINP